MSHTSLTPSFKESFDFGSIKEFSFSFPKTQSNDKDQNNEYGNENANENKQLKEKSLNQSKIKAQSQTTRKGKNRKRTFYDCMEYDAHVDTLSNDFGFGCKIDTFKNKIDKMDEMNENDNDLLLPPPAKKHISQKMFENYKRIANPFDENYSQNKMNSMKCVQIPRVCGSKRAFLDAMSDNERENENENESDSEYFYLPPRKQAKLSMSNAKNATLSVAPKKHWDFVKSVNVTHTLSASDCESDSENENGSETDSELTDSDIFESDFDIKRVEKELCEKLDSVKIGNDNNKEKEKEKEKETEVDIDIDKKNEDSSIDKDECGFNLIEWLLNNNNNNNKTQRRTISINVNPAFSDVYNLCSCMAGVKVPATQKNFESDFFNNFLKHNEDEIETQKTKDFTKSKKYEKKSKRLVRLHPSFCIIKNENENENEKENKNECGNCFKNEMEIEMSNNDLKTHITRQLVESCHRKIEKNVKNDNCMDCD